MCYSKEVSLAVGGTMAICTAVSYWRYVRPRSASASGTPTVSASSGGDSAQPDRLRPFFSSILLGHACIAVHQLMEYVAIDTGNAAVYKVGLLFSLSCMVFLMRSLEAISSARFGSRVFLVLLAIVGADLFLRETTFENRHFFVRGNAHVLWGVVWMTEFFYWNAAILHVARRLRTDTNRTLLRRYGWLVLNLSWAASILYSYTAGLARDVDTAQTAFDCAGFGDLTAGHDALADTPSVWCVFAGAQVLLVPGLFAALSRRHDASDTYTPPEGGLPWLRLAFVACAASGVLYGLYPIVRGVAEKMVTH